MKWSRKAAEQGDAMAQLNLGLMYGIGLGVKQNYSEAYVWSSLAAASGHGNAMSIRDKLSVQLSPADLKAAQGRVTSFLNRLIHESLLHQLKTFTQRPDLWSNAKSMPFFNAEKNEWVHSSSVQKLVAAYNLTGSQFAGPRARCIIIMATYS